MLIGFTVGRLFRHRTFEPDLSQFHLVPFLRTLQCSFCVSLVVMHFMSIQVRRTNVRVGTSR